MPIIASNETVAFILESIDNWGISYLLWQFIPRTDSEKGKPDFKFMFLIF